MLGDRPAPTRQRDPTRGIGPVQPRVAGQGQRIGLFGASILGPMIVTAALSLADLIHIRPPAEAILAAQFFIGIALGAGPGRAFVAALGLENAPPAPLRSMLRDAEAATGEILRLNDPNQVYAWSTIDND